MLIEGAANMRWKIIEKDRSTFGDRLEERARRLVARVAQDTDDIVATVSREIAWVLDRLERMRALRKRRDRSLLRVECYIHTELHGVEARTPKYDPSRFPEREKLQHRLFMIERERRSVDAEHEREIQELQERLLGLLERHSVLAGWDGRP